MTNRLPLFLALLCLGLVACDSSNPDGGVKGLGSSAVKVEGASDAETSFDGYAVFTIVMDEGEPYLNLVLTDRSLATVEAARLVTFQRTGNRPQPGTYAIDRDDVQSFFFVEAEGEDGVLVGGDRGTLTITRSTDRALEGSFTFTGIDLASKEEVTVSGTFKAVYVEDEEAGGGL